MEKETTVTITSCDRFDLLAQTVESLIRCWDYEPPKAVIINEDSGLEIPASIIRLFEKWPNTELLITEGDHNQIAAIDRMYRLVKTPYVMAVECDWLFDRPGFIQPSLDILESDPKIVTVWLRYPNERNRHPVQGMNKTPNGTRYQKFQVGYRRVWHGFTFSPGLRRLEDYKLIAPFSSYHLGNSLDTEAAIGRIYLEKGFRAATLLQGYCRHLGYKRGLPK